MILILDENGLVEYEELVEQQELRPVKHKDAKDLELRLFAEADKNKDNKLDEDEFEKFQVGPSDYVVKVSIDNFSFQDISKQRNLIG